MNYKYICAFLVSAVLTLPSLSSEGFAAGLVSGNSGNGVWKSHISLDIDSHAFYNNNIAVSNNVKYMAESEQYVYALIYGRLAKNNSGGFYTYYYFPARLDKSQPDAMLEPLLESTTLSGIDVEDMEYSISGNYLAILYRNKNIDIIYDDGRVLSNTDLSAPIEFGLPNTINISADGKNIYAAHSLGYVKIDAASGKTVSKKRLNKSIDFVTETPSFTYYGIGEEVYYTPAGMEPDSFNDLTLITTACLSGKNLDELSCEGTYLNLYKLLPNADGGFISLGYPIGSGNGYTLNSFIPNPNAESDPEAASWHMSTIVSYKFASNDLYYMGLTNVFNHKYIYERQFSPSLHGFTFSDATNFYDIKSLEVNYDFSATDPDADYASRLLTTLKKDATKNSDISQGDERFKVHASRNGETFWIFYPRVGLKKRTASGSGTSTTWSDPEIHLTNAHTAQYAEYLNYVPGYGMLVSATGMDNRETGGNNFQTSGLSLFRNGKWSIHSMKRHNPNIYQMVPQARGCFPDPLDPKYIYSNGITTGLLRQNLDDPKDLIHFTRANDSYRSDPSFVNMIGTVTAYPYNGITTPGFDADGTMWVMRDCNADAEGDYAEIYYWPAEERLACKTAADYPAHPMKKFIHRGHNVRNTSMVVPFKHEKNKNLIGVVAIGQIPHGFVYDHNGTPDDTSDDKVVDLDGILDEHGDLLQFLQWETVVFEDPYDGKIIFASQLGLFVTSREELFGEKKSMSRLFVTEHGEREGVMKAISNSGAVSIYADDKMQKWIATNDDGVYVISPDRTHIVAHYNTDNSGILSDQPLGFCYNPERNSMWIGTRLGISELFLEGSAEHSASLQPKVAPMIVEPHYMGYLSFRNLDDAKDYTIVNANGEEIAKIRSAGNRAQWTPADTPAGIYHLLEAPDCEFILNR